MILNTLELVSAKLHILSKLKDNGMQECVRTCDAGFVSPWGVLSLTLVEIEIFS